MTRADRFRAGWDRFWFQPETPTHLAIFRSIRGGTHLWRVCCQDAFLEDLLRSISLGDAFHFPQGPLKYIPVASVGTIKLLHHALGVALLASAVGFATRVSTATACVLLYYLSQRGMYGKLMHVDAIPIIVLGIVTLSHAGAALSVDRWLRSRWKRWPFAARDVSPSGEYRWPLQLLRLYVCMVFCLAAMSKLVTSGPGWVTSDNLALVFAATPDNQRLSARMADVPAAQSLACNEHDHAPSPRRWGAAHGAARAARPHPRPCSSRHGQRIFRDEPRVPSHSRPWLRRADVDDHVGLHPVGSDRRVRLAKDRRISPSPRSGLTAGCGRSTRHTDNWLVGLRSSETATYQARGRRVPFRNARETASG